MKICDLNFNFNKNSNLQQMKQLIFCIFFRIYFI